jgi:RNA polymerase sigma-70 factor (ECF subfamily)
LSATSPAGDFELLDRWQAGDVQAGDELFRRHFDALYRFFSNKSADHADDLIQKTMLGCIEHRDRFRRQSTFRTYLFVIDLSNMSLRALGTTPSAAVARDQREHTLDVALTELPLDQQIALEMAYRQQLSGPEIAEVLGIEPNTVRSRLARARKALKDALVRLGVEFSPEL